MSNRLATETSPYLLQHKDNPVDWFPWGVEAFELAKQLDRPIFLSIGYSSCHWCHVMEHESFEDEQTAEVLNSHFVCVKVDREERPDIDDTYMQAVQLMSGRGGWPMSLFLDHDKAPFFAGTYFPKHDRGQHPGFLTLCEQIGQMWKTRRAELLEVAAQVRDALSESISLDSMGGESDSKQILIERLLSTLADSFDPELGGFGPAPKFPPHTALEFLLNVVSEQDSPHRALARPMLVETLTRMCAGGIRDHVGGGFHRYSTDARWLLPHFEKMLYDNALMLANLADASRQIPEHAAEFRDAAHGIIQWLETEMIGADGCFYSALDADSEGQEGKFYVWTSEEIDQILGERAEKFKAHYGVIPLGNFRDEATGRVTGENILNGVLGNDFALELQLLRDVRRSRVRPETDIKCLVGWNGLAIAALSKAGRADLALRAAKAILNAEASHGALPRHITDGIPSGRAFLEDYAYLIDGLLALICYIDEPETLKGEIGRLTNEMVTLFYDELDGGFWATSDHHEFLFARSKPMVDQPSPSGNAIAMRCLIHTGDFDRAEKTLRSAAGWMERAPHATEALATSALMLFAARGIQLAPPVKLDLSRSDLVTQPGTWAEAQIEIRLSPGVRIGGANSSDPQMHPTRVRIIGVEHQVDLEGIEQTIEGNSVSIPFRLKLPADSTGSQFSVEITYQACTDRECMPSRTVLLTGQLRAQDYARAFQPYGT